MVVPHVSERDRLLKLLAQKDDLEKRIKEHGIVLQTNRVDMKESLVDDAGFPRTDIDVLQVRHARHHIICLQNDLKALMLDIENGLHAVHAEQNASGNGEASTKMSNMMRRDEPMDVVQSSLKPFVRVTTLRPNSPAERAGLQVNDEIVEFGTLNASNFNRIAQIGDIVQHSVDKAIRVRVQRSTAGGSGGAVRLDELELVPGRWAGAGLLGCVVVPCE